jgi:hypothetical protein
MKVHQTWEAESQILWRRLTSDRVVTCTNQPMGDVDYKRPSLLEVFRLFRISCYIRLYLSLLLLLFASCSVFICFLLVSLLLGSLLNYDLYKDWFRNKRGKQLFIQNLWFVLTQREHIS